jgi:hypothetical protein
MQPRRTPLTPPPPIHSDRFGFGMTENEVRRLQDIFWREHQVRLSLEEAWARGIELLAFAKMLLESLPPDDSAP